MEAYIGQDAADACRACLRLGDVAKVSPSGRCGIGADGHGEVGKSLQH